MRQGWFLSPILFNIYSEEIFSEALSGLEVGIRINGEYLNNIRYADDTVLLAANLPDMMCLVDRVNLINAEYGLDIIIEKTKYLVISRTSTPGRLLLDSRVTERVGKFKYRGITLYDQWEPDKEIRTRIEMARATFSKMKHRLCCKDLSLATKIRTVECYVFPVLMYGMEAWTLTKVLEKKIEAFEMWIYRRLLKISWVDHVTNDEVLRRVGKNIELLLNIKKRKLDTLVM